MAPYNRWNHVAADHYADLLAQLAQIEWQFDLNELHSPENIMSLCAAHHIPDFLKTDFKSDYIRFQNMYNL
jgi:hypothetical protein